MTVDFSMNLLQTGCSGKQSRLNPTSMLGWDHSVLEHAKPRSQKPRSADACVRNSAQTWGASDGFETQGMSNNPSNQPQTPHVLKHSGLACGSN